MLSWLLACLQKEENKANGSLCAQNGPCVYQREMQAVTIRFLKSKVREKIEKKNIVLPFADLFHGKNC